MRRIGLAVVLMVGVLVPLAVRAQQAGKVARIGVFAVSAADFSPRIEAFRNGLREHGYVEGKNIVVEYRYAEGKLDRLPDLAAELVALKVDVIVTASTPAVRAPKKPRAQSRLSLRQLGTQSQPVLSRAWRVPGKMLLG